MSGIYAGAQTPKLYLGETPIGGGTWLEDESNILILVGDVGQTNMYTGLNMSDVYLSGGFTLEACSTVSAEHTTNGRLFELYCNNLNPINALAVNGAKSEQVQVCVASTWFTDSLNMTYPTGEPHTLAMTVDAELNIKVYFDGELSATATASGLSAGTLRQFYFRSGSTSNRTVNGVNHCVRAYTRALTADEIRQNYLVDKELYDSGVTT